MSKLDAAKAEHIVEQLRRNPLRGRDLRGRAMELLDNIGSYDWSGIYVLEGETLVLDEFIGDDTEHTRIPVGVGVCGTAVAENANQIVADVRDLSNYLSCSVNTRSEIVVLIRRNGKILGQIDIDGHEPGAFGPEDEAFLEKIAEILAERWE